MIGLAVGKRRHVTGNPGFGGRFPRRLLQ
jgi:hypothetical protein